MFGDWEDDRSPEQKAKDDALTCLGRAQELLERALRILEEVKLHSESINDAIGSKDAAEKVMKTIEIMQTFIDEPQSRAKDLDERLGRIAEYVVEHYTPLFAARTDIMALINGKELKK